MVVPAPRAGGQEEEEEVVEEAGMDDAPEQPPALQPPLPFKSFAWKHQLTRTGVWFLLLLALQAVGWPFWINPIASTVVDYSKVALVSYKGILGTRQDNTVVAIDEPTIVVIENTTVSDAATATAFETAKAVEQLEELRVSKIQQLQDAQVAVDESRDTLASSVDSLQQDVDTLTKAIKKHQSSLKPKSANLAGMSENLQEILQGESVATARLLPRVRRYLGDFEMTLLDLQNFEFLNVPDGQGCDQDFDGSIMSRSDLDLAVSGLKEEAYMNALDIMEDPDAEEDIRVWVRTSPPVKSAALPKPKKRGSGGSSLEAVRKVIDARISQERADQTGEVDYAAVHNGAAVIRHGERATTPALVDGLPILNRLAALAKLRFYGYGAEAALTPTYPRDALGQCWSFEKTVGKFSSFGTLSLGLSKPIYVGSVSIEHPPKEVTDRVNTAIRSFRVFGFERPDAQGKAWPLGDFEYMIGEGSIQDFDVDDEINGEYVPMLQSISIAVDSNWGMSYACLYRLRVHGEGEL